MNTNLESNGNVKLINGFNKVMCMPGYSLCGDTPEDFESELLEQLGIKGQYLEEIVVDDKICLLFAINEEDALFLQIISGGRIPTLEHVIHDLDEQDQMFYPERVREYVK